MKSANKQLWQNNLSRPAAVNGREKEGDQKPLLLFGFPLLPPHTKMVLGFRRPQIWYTGEEGKKDQTVSKRCSPPSLSPSGM